MATGNDETMNCEEYRLAIAADPSQPGGDEHVASCGECRAYRDEMLQLDRRIARALTIDVPPLVMPELDAGNVVSLPRGRRYTSAAWLAMAASVVLATFVGIRLFGGAVTYASLEDEIVAHLDHEPYALRVTDRPVSDRQLASVVPANVATMKPQIGLVTYAMSCVIHGHTVPHLVIQGEHGPVTILLMPEETVDAAKHIDGKSITGVILPVGKGSIAIIGESSENLEPIEENVLNSVAWST